MKYVRIESHSQTIELQRFVLGLIDAGEGKCPFETFEHCLTQHFNSFNWSLIVEEEEKKWLEKAIPGKLWFLPIRNGFVCPF